MVGAAYQRSIPVEGSVGTIFDLFKKKRESVGKNDKKILEHQF